jgi:hypothetical protein
MRIFIIMSLSALLLVGCGLQSRNAGIFGKQAAATEKQSEKIDRIDRATGVNSDERLAHIGAFSVGIDYSLNKLTEPSVEVLVAKTVNQRIQALSNKPDFNEVKEVLGIVDGLLSTMKTQHDEATSSLQKKDVQISKLMTQVKDLDKQMQDQVQNVLKQSQANAMKADQYKETLNGLDSFWGMSAVFYGLKKLLVKLSWTLAIGGVLFLILRLAAASNPIAGAVFSVFETVISWVINCLKHISPKATTIAGFTDTRVYNSSKQFLNKIVDNVEHLKDIETRVGHDITVKELLSELSKTLDAAEKEEVAKIKQSLGY